MATTFYYSDRAPTTSTDTVITGYSRAPGTTTTLTRVDIGSDVTRIENLAFQNCTSLNTVNIIGNNLLTIGNNAFENCTAITSIIIPSGVTSMGYYAFFGCNALASITIPNSVTSIGPLAFYVCRALTSITIPNTMNTIAQSTFYGCINLTSVTIPNSVTNIEAGAFQVCSSLYNITLPTNLTSIGDQAFAFTSLTSITIPNSVTTIGTGVFEGCTALNNVALSNSINSISRSMFYGCTSLNNIIIPNTVTSIGANAFFYCSSLTTINIPSSVTEINTAFNGCSSLISITVDEANLFYSSDAHGVLHNKNKTTIIQYPTGRIGAYAILGTVDTIGLEAFILSNNLISITIPNSVITIQSTAFGNCTSLTAINIPDSVTNIEEAAFLGCTNLTSVIMSNNITIIMNNLFRSCTNLTNVIIGNKINTISTDAFRDCSSLTNITLPSSIQNIGNNAFRKCDNLIRINFLGDAPTLGNNVFLNTPNLEIYRYSTKSTWPDAFGGKDVYFIDMPIPKGFQTFGTLNLSLGQLKIISNTSSYQNINKLSEVAGSSFIGENLESATFDYETFVYNCELFGLEPNAISNALGTIDFSKNYVIMRGAIDNNIPNESISNIGNNIIQISYGRRTRPIGYFYKFFVMWRQGWDTVRYNGTDYPVENNTNIIGKISLIKTCGYQNINKLAETAGTSPLIGNFNNVALDYNTFANDCSTIGLDANTISNALGEINFSYNYVVIRARRGNRIPNDSISDLGNGIINIDASGPTFGPFANWYRFFVMCRRGWNTVRLNGVDYPI
jgi:hypothetical protein